MKLPNKVPLLKNKSRDSQTNPWMELVHEKQSFLQILSALTGYYRQFDKKDHKSESMKFREDLIRSNPDTISIFLKKFSLTEYLIYAEIHEGSNNRSDYWIHIDGIKEEREKLMAQGNKNHPVFSIVCLTDLYEKNCVPIAKDIEEYLQK